jgi:hypothetical protein
MDADEIPFLPKAPTYVYILVGGLEHGFYFPFHIWDVILPIDELICFKMVETTNQIIHIYIYGAMSGGLTPP